MSKIETIEKCEMADEESHDRIDNDCILSMARFTRNLVANVESNQLDKYSCP